MQYVIKVALLVLVSIFTQISFAAPAAPSGPSPIGTWQTYDLDGIARSYVRFSQSGGKLVGTIVKELNPAKGQAADPICTKCPAPWKGRKKVGITVVWGLQKQGDKWVDGRVLDTDSGGVYRCQVSVSPDNRTLYLHAYVAVPILGKTVNWSRVK